MQDGKVIDPKMNPSEYILDEYFLSQWRNRLLRIILFSSIGLGFVALITSIVSDIQTGHWIQLIITTVIYAILLIITFFRLPYNLRAGTVIFLLFALLLNSLFETGMRGDAKLYLIAISLVSLMFFGPKFGWIVLGVSFITSGIIGWGIISQRLNIQIMFDQLDPAIWISALASTLLITGVLMVGFITLQREFIKSHGREQMTIQELQAERGGLESIVNERTRELATASDIGRILSQEQNLDQLLSQAVQLIQERYSLYYTQIYLVDPKQRALVLRSGSGTVGAELLQRGHRLPIESNSINGRAVVEQQPVIVSNTIDSAIFRPNPLLPATQSEVAVPLIVANTVIGILDMQSDVSESFKEDNMLAYNIMAGLLATAIRNAQLFEEAQEAQAKAQAQVQVLSRVAWSDYLDGVHQQENFRFSYSREADTGETLVEKTDLNLEKIDIPLNVTGTRIGSIVLNREETYPWSVAEEELAKAAADQVARRIESIRLLEQADRYRAEAEAATRRLTREGWQSFLIDDVELGYIYDQNQTQDIRHVNLGDHLEKIVYQIPLEVQGQPIGEIAIGGDSKPDDATIALINSVAERLSEHLETLRLSQNTINALAETDALYKIIAELNITRNYEGVLNTLAEHTLVGQADQSLVLSLFNRPLGDGPMPDWIIPVAHKADLPIQIAPRYPLSAFETKPGTIFTNQPVVIQNVKTDSRLDRITRKLFSDVFQSTSAIIVPLVLGSDAIGFLMANFGKEMEFDTNDINRLANIAGQAAIVVQGQQLLERTRARARQEQILREVTSQITSASDTDTVLRRTAQELGRTLKRQAFVYLSPLAPEQDKGTEGKTTDDSE